MRSFWSVAGRNAALKLDSVRGSRAVAAWPTRAITFGVAYNPYLPEDEMPGERQRLQEKLKTGIVTSIWLQFGTDLQRLSAELAHINRIAAVTKSSHENHWICICTHKTVPRSISLSAVARCVLLPKVFTL